MKIPVKFQLEKALDTGILPSKYESICSHVIVTENNIMVATGIYFIVIKSEQKSSESNILLSESQIKHARQIAKERKSDEMEFTILKNKIKFADGSTDSLVQFDKKLFDELINSMEEIISGSTSKFGKKDAIAFNPYYMMRISNALGIERNMELKFMFSETRSIFIYDRGNSIDNKDEEIGTFAILMSVIAKGENLIPTQMIQKSENYIKGLKKPQTGDEFTSPSVKKTYLYYEGKWYYEIQFTGRCQPANEEVQDLLNAEFSKQKIKVVKRK